MPPTFFAQDGTAPPAATYDEPHIAALHLSGLTCLLQAGHDTADIRDARQRSLAYLYGLFCHSGDMAGSFSPSPSTRLFYGFWVGEIIRALAETVLLEDQLLRGPSSVQQADAEMEFAEEVIVTLETDEPLAFNRAITAFPTAPLNDVEMEFGQEASISLETGDALAFEQIVATNS